MIYRELKPDQYDLLRDFLYEAIFIPEGAKAPDRSIIERPELAVYYEDFGTRAGDLAIAADDEEIVGLVWSRIMSDYGHVDDDTPSLAMSVIKEQRGQGIGTRLLQEMLSLLREKGFEKVSLSVQKENYAARMYEKAGFRTIRENDDEYIMVCKL